MDLTTHLGHLQIDELRLPPSQEWMEQAGAWRFVRLGSGAAYWLDSARPRVLTEGELLVLGPAAKGVVRASQLTEVVLYAFRFAPELLCGFFTVAERHFFESGAGAAGRVQFLPSTHPLSRRFATLAAQHATACQLAERAEVLRLVAEFFGEAMPSLPPPPVRPGSAQERFEQLVARMPDLELINHTPEELARLCGCGVRHFGRLFHGHFGEPLRARQTELRLAKARQLLSSTDRKILDVALESGYQSLSLFNALFKRRFGLSPSAWRRKAGMSQGKLACLLAALLLLLGCHFSDMATGARDRSDTMPPSRFHTT